MIVLDYAAVRNPLVMPSSTIGGHLIFSQERHPIRFKISWCSLGLCAYRYHIRT